MKVSNKQSSTKKQFSNFFCILSVSYVCWLFSWADNVTKFYLNKHLAHHDNNTHMRIYLETTDNLLSFQSLAVIHSTCTSANFCFVIVTPWNRQFHYDSIITYHVIRDGVYCSVFGWFFDAGLFDCIFIGFACVLHGLELDVLLYMLLSELVR